MKKILLALLIFFPVSVFAGTYDDMAQELMKKIPAKDQTKVIAVMPFSSDDEFSSDAKIATEEMTRALIDSGANVSERSQIDKMLKEQELQQVGVLTNENAGEIGQGLGAKYVVLGTISKIDKYGEDGNIGLKINVKLVTSANYKVIAAASGEAAAGDASAKYKRKAPRKAAEYPQFLEIFGGATMFTYSADYDDADKKYDMKTGYSLGARMVDDNKGFYTSSWEFLFSTQKFDTNDMNNMKFNIYQINWTPTIRLPLWVYFPSLPDYTSLSIGYAIGLAINNVEYLDNNKETNSIGIGICSSAIIGFRLGISDSISFFTDFRYTPSFLNEFRRSPEIANDNVSVQEKMTGKSAYFGISLAP